MSEKVNRKLLKAALVSLAVLIVSLIVLGAFELIVKGISARLDYLKTGSRWSADGSPFAVVAVNTEDSAGFDFDQLYAYEMSMNSALNEASVATDNTHRAWTWNASFETVQSISGPKDTASATTTVCAGDFFVFHNMKFISGSGFLNDTSNPMGVVLDKNLAWKIFGAIDVVGMTLYIGDEEYTVSGVCEPYGKTGVRGYTYGESPRLYMSYPGFAKVGSGNFTCYEAAMPNPVRSFAKNIFDSVVSVNGNTADETEATARFTLKNRFDNMKKLKYSWISSNRISYPYWENEARVYDYRCAVMMVVEVIFAALAGISLVSALILTVGSGYSPVRSVKNVIDKKLSSRKK